MSAADDYEHALGGLRGHIVYGEQTAGDTPIAWVQVKVALPYLRDAERALVAERTRAEAAEADRDHWRAQATMAAPCVDAASERDAARRAATFAEMERDTLRGLTDAMRADNVRLRGIVESVRSARAVSAAAAERYTAAWDAVGTMPPTPAQSEEIAAALLAAYEAGDALTAALDAAREGR